MRIFLMCRKTDECVALLCEVESSTVANATPTKIEWKLTANSDDLGELPLACIYEAVRLHKTLHNVNHTTCSILITVNPESILPDVLDNA